MRDDWPVAATLRVKELQRELRPDVVHGEYLQCAEALLAIKQPRVRTITLHDVAEFVHAPPTGRVSLRKLYRNLQRRMTLSLERRVVERVDHVFTLSARDARALQGTARSVSSLHVGVDMPETHWSPTTSTPTAVFAGAMWRYQNQEAAAYLARDVLPHLRKILPDATLRIVGASPPPETLALENIPGVDVIGDVDSFEDEYLASSVVLCPTMVEAGILLKAVKSMACGAPTVLNSKSASSFEGLVRGTHALVADTALEMANQAALLMTDTDLAVRLGRAGREFVAERFSWSTTAAEIHARFSQALDD